LDNAHAAAFYRRLGMTETHRTAQDIYFSYPRDRFASNKTGYMSIIEQEKQNG
jgi:hypothetical protein